METKQCIKCKKEKTLDNFTFRKETGKYRGVCHECRRKQYRENPKIREEAIRRAKEHYEKNKDAIKQRRKAEYRQDIRKVMYKSAKARAKEYNIPFNIDVEDIIVPQKCPIFGFDLEIGGNQHKLRSPSLDRIIPEKGYVKGNIIVVSMKANTMKSNATIEEIKQLYDFYKDLMDKQKEMC